MNRRIYYRVKDSCSYRGIILIRIDSFCSGYHNYTPVTYAGYRDIISANGWIRDSHCIITLSIHSVERIYVRELNTL